MCKSIDSARIAQLSTTLDQIAALKTEYHSIKRGLKRPLNNAIQEIQQYNSQANRLARLHTEINANLRKLYELLK